METLTAPDLTPGYPSRGARLGPAWTEAWSVMTETPGEWHDGRTLWVDIAARHGLSPETLRGLIFRMAKAGHLESETRQMVTPRGPRSRTHFRYVQKG